jgi:hypothetical protein
MHELAPSRVLTGPNPFEVATGLDYRHQPRPEVPCYSETWFFSAWSPEQGVGVFIHAGVDPEDATLWYAQVIAYLPDGELVIDRCWGRPTDQGVIDVGNLRMTVDAPLERWTLHFEGAGERTTTLKCGQGLIGSGPGVPFSFDVDVTAAGPVWDMFAASGLPELGWAGIHHEQNCWTRGRLTVGDRGWEIDGVGFRDHSNGARDIAGLGGDRFWGFVSPTTGRSVQGIMIWNRAGELEFATASIHDQGTLEVINTDVTFTGIEDTAGNPAELEMTLVRPGGERLAVPGRRLHNVTISISDPNHNMNGTYLEGDPLILSEAQARLDWPDGDVFYGHIETSSRLKDLKTA